MIIAFKLGFAVSSTLFEAGKMDIAFKGFALDTGLEYISILLNFLTENFSEIGSFTISVISLSYCISEIVSFF